MKRGLLDMVTIASLLLALAAAAVWLRSYAVMDLVRVHRMDWDVAHNTVPQSEMYLISSRGRVTWTARQEVPRIDVYLQRDFELHWQAGSPGEFAGDGFWLGWVVLSALALPAGRVGLWTWRRKPARAQGNETGGHAGPERSPGPDSEWRRAYGLRSAWAPAILARFAWTAALAAAVVAVFWIRSYPYFERVDWKLWSNSAGVQLNSSMGSLMLAWTHKGPDRMIARQDFAFIRTCEPPTRGPLYQAADLTGPYVQAAGFTLGSDGSTPLAYNVLIVPYWFIEAVLLGLGLLAWRYVRRQSKRAEGCLCARCGYDLRATPERCPECGLEPLNAISLFAR